MFIPVDWSVEPNYDDGRAGTLVPLTGEVIPPDVLPIPTIPLDVPIAGPIIKFVGEGEHAVWNDVWNWVTGTAKSAYSVGVNVDASIVSYVENAIESWVGAEIKAVSGFINDAFDYAETGLQLVEGVISYEASWVFDQIQGIEGDIAGIVTTIAGIEAGAITNIERLLGDLADNILSTAEGLTHLLETWAIDNIWDPLVAEVAAIDNDIRAEITSVAEGVIRIAQQLVDDLDTKVAAELAALGVTVAALAAEATDCVEPMCEQLGPGSSLSSLLQALEDSGLLALLAGLAFADPTLDEKLALTFARVTGPTVEAAVADWLVPLQADTADA